MNSTKDEPRRVLALINPKSGIWFNPFEILTGLREAWDQPEINLYYQESKSPEDGKVKVRRAIADGVDTVIAIGGDGMINTIGAELVGTNVALAVLPAGSGNGFARHFGIPLRASLAAKVLRNGNRFRIDVGYVGDRPFFVTAGLAWDADLVKGFDSSPVRGITPYILSGIYHFFTYEPQDFILEIDGKTVNVDHPLVLTVANLTQYGGGAKIAPDALPDDGKLALVVVPRSDPIEFLFKLGRLFDGRINKLPEIRTWSFRSMTVIRERPGPIQIDGELIEADRELKIEVCPSALEVIVPAESNEQRTAWSQE